MDVNKLNWIELKLDVAQSWCGHVGAKASNKMVVM
jgi:hypothetical protein